LNDALLGTSLIYLFFLPQVKYQLRFKDEKDKNHRFSIYKDNYKKVEEHNIKFMEGTESYTLSLNEFSTWTQDELKARNGLKVPEK
jgi:hypothetical protein